MFKISLITLVLYFSFNIDSSKWANGQTLSSKLNIEVYYETLCPDSKRFINTQISKIYRNSLLNNITNIVLIPYGKANYFWNESSKFWDFSCQHGEDECLGNRIHNCHIYFNKNFNQHFPFINCTMSNIKDNILDVASSCAKKYSKSFDRLLSCAKDPLGNSLLHSAGVLTDSLLPKLNYVPWIVVDRYHTNEMQKETESDLVKYVCNNYKGSVDTSSICVKNSKNRLEFNLPNELSILAFIVSLTILI